MAGLCFVGAVNLNQLGVQAVQGVVLILVTENAFFPMYATLSLFPQELPLFIREHRAGMYPIHLYYISRMASLVIKKKKKNDINYYYRFFNEIYSYINLFLGARINIRACVIYNNNLLARWFKKYNRGLWIDITYHNYHHECLYSMWLLFIDN